VPYLSPATRAGDVKDMVELVRLPRLERLASAAGPDFTPTPMTLATDMYYSGYHPNTGQAVHVPAGAYEKAMQRSLRSPIARTARGRPSAAHRRRGPRPKRLAGGP